MAALAQLKGSSRLSPVITPVWKINAQVWMMSTDCQSPSSSGAIQRMTTIPQIMPTTLFNVLLNPNRRKVP
jgi:L-serine deaminase